MNDFHDLSLIDLTEDTIMPDANENSDNTLIQRVSVKIPPFWEQSPEIWFVQVEAQFKNAKIVTDDSQFNTVIGVIETSILNRVRDAVLNPTEGAKYANLKAAMLQEFADSDYTKMKKLFSELSIGDRKPTYLLNEMRRLGGASVNDDVLKTLWMNQLPMHIRTILATSTATLTELANIADKIAEVSAQGSVEQVERTTPTTSTDARLTSIEKQVNQLVSAMNSFKSKNSRSRSRSFSNASQRRRSRTPSKNKFEGDKSDLCWYHETYGNKAKQCKGEPCQKHQSKN